MARDGESRGEQKKQNKSVQHRGPTGEGARAPESREPGKKLRRVIWVGFVFFSRALPPMVFATDDQTGKKTRWSHNPDRTGR